MPILGLPTISVTERLLSTCVLAYSGIRRYRLGILCFQIGLEYGFRVEAIPFFKQPI